MSTEGQFVRATPQRSSRGHYKLPSSVSSGAAKPSSSSKVSQGVSLEEARQRAEQAAAFYHRTVLRVGGDSSEDGIHQPQSSTMSGVKDAVTRTRAGDALRAGVTPTSHDTHYKQQLRDGFIELRNTYSVQGTSKAGPAPAARPTQKSYGHHSGASASHHRHHQKPRPRPALGAVHEGLRASHERHRRPAHHTHKSLADRKGLYKSNSSLELDHLDHLEKPSAQFAAARREFGSTSSLDIMSASGDSFFALLQEYRANQSADQRAPAPPKMQETLRGRPANRPTNVPFVERGQLQKQQEVVTASPPQVSNGSLAAQTDDTDSPDVSGSPKLKAKSLKNKERKSTRNKGAVSEGSSGGGIFKKLRGAKSTDADGAKSPESATEGDSRLEDRQKRKAFVHFDCQSVGVNLLDVMKRRHTAPSEDSTSLGKRKNTTTGASAASGVRDSADFSNANLEDTDGGDGKSNDLVLSCPFFRNEVGGEEERIVCLNRFSAQKRVQQLLGTKGLETQVLHRKPVCNGVAVLDTSQNPRGVSEASLHAYKGHVVEYVDQGAVYYRNFFHEFDHQNFFGVDDNLGPTAVTIRREKLDERERGTPTGRTEGAGHCYIYRLIVRTSELTTLRGSILEEAIPSSSRLSSTRGLPAKDVLEYVVPDLNLSCLKQATVGQKTADQLLKVDEQGLTKTYKIGVMYCRAGQSTEEEMYNNEHAGPAFEEFVQLLGDRIQLKGFDKYRGGLDCRTDSTGTESVFKEFDGYEIMFHISTLLPFTPNNKQQLLRKRHIGNDIVTIIFQEPGALAFTPKSVRSHFQHVFIIVRAHNPNTDNVKYSMAVTRSKDVPPFGPAILDGMMFPKSQEFTDFLLMKVINAENAVHRSEKFIAMATRTRQEYLKDLATNFVSSSSMDSSSKLSKFSLGSGRRRERPKARSIPDMYSKGALVWSVQLEDFGQSSPVDCFLAIGSEVIALVEEKSKEVAFTTPCMSVIGWTPHGNSLRLYYDRGECVMVKTLCAELDEINEIVSRLSMVSDGCETVEMTLRRNSMGQLGFHVHYEGIISDVEPSGFAYREGLRASSRLVEICKVAVSTLTHEQMIDLLRTSVQVKVVVIPPYENGNPRRGHHDPAWLGHSPLNNQYAAWMHDSNEDNSQYRIQNTGHQINSRMLQYSDSGAPGSRRPLPVMAYPSYNSDFRFMPTSLEPHFRQASSSVGTHGKQLSHDSGSSRGRVSEGQSSEDLDARHEGYPPDGYPSGDERIRHHRGSHDDNLQWSGKVTIYPAYSRNSYQDPSGPAPVSPRSNQPPTQWYDQNTNATQDYDHRNAETYLNASHASSSTSYSASSAFSPVTQNVSPHSYAPYYPPRDTERYSGDRPAHVVPASVTNLGHHSDTISSHSSGHSNGSSKREYREELRTEEYRDELRARQEQDFKEEFRARQEQEHLRMEQKARQQHFAKDVKSAGALSPPRRHTVVGHRGRSIMESSPRSSNDGSPRASHRSVVSHKRVNKKRNLTMVASDENLTADSLRPAAASPASRSQHTAGRTGGSSRTFQEDLMRLIDPDLSLTEGDLTRDWVEPQQSHKGSRRKHGRLQRIHRTYSDESMCGRTKGRSPRHIDPSDFNADSPPPQPPAKPPRNLSQDRLSPRADIPTKPSPGQGQGAGSAIMPLPDSSQGLNWNNLLDAANRAFLEGDMGKKSGSLGALGDPSLHESGEHSGSEAGPQHSSHSGNAPNQHSAGKVSSSRRGHSTQDIDALTSTPTLAGRGAMSSASYQGSDTGSGGGPRLQDLETRLTQLERDFDKERGAKEALQVEVERLQHDNARLQEESATAAAQLRRFTEWFFKHIDKH